MKKGIWKSSLIILGMGLAFGMVSAGSASALSIQSGAIQVGGLDTLLQIDFLANSGDQNEVDWVNGVLLTTFTTSDMTKYDTQIWYEVDGSSGDMQALDLLTDGGYFFIKTGNFVVDGLPDGVNQGDIDMPEHFLYQNEPLSDWAVIAFSVMTSELNAFLDDLGYPDATVRSFDVTKFSHIGEFDGEEPPPPDIPEPMTMLLFGTGLVGLAGARRKMRNQ